jgi:hypothetical protein
MTEDKKLAKRLFEFKNIEARHFPKRSKGKKADFELYLKNHLFGYCELKSIIDYGCYGEHHDPTYNKIQNKIHEATKQFKSINPDHSRPNIVFFINRTKKVGWQDLWYVLTGQATPPNQSAEPIDLRYFNRLARKGDLAITDYFIWADVFGKYVSFIINSDSNFAKELKETISSKAYEKIKRNGGTIWLLNVPTVTK